VAHLCAGGAAVFLVWTTSSTRLTVLLEHVARVGYHACCKTVGCCRHQLHCFLMFSGGRQCMVGHLEKMS
jgi:hypothetical protein